MASISGEFLGAINYVDIAIGVVVLVGCWNGYRTGLIRNALRLIASITGLVCAYVFSAPIALFMETQFGTHSAIRDEVSRAVATVLSRVGSDPLGGNNPLDAIMQQLAQLNLPAAALQMLQTQLNSVSSTVLTSFVGNVPELIGDFLATMLINSIIFIAIMALTNVLGNMLYWFLRDVLRFAGRGVDSFGGMLLGLLRSVVVVALALAFAVPVLAYQTTDPFVGLAIQLQHSVLANAILNGFYWTIAEGIPLLSQQLL